MSLRDCRPTRLTVAASVVALGALLGIVRVLRRAVASAADVPLSPATAGWRVGADYLERRGVLGECEVGGEIDDLSAFARSGFDPEVVAPVVRDFYERTADHRLAYGVRWHRPFRVGAALAARLTSRIEQLNLPGPGESGVERLESRFTPVAPGVDPREGARAWVRTREDGTAVFVAIYAHHDCDGVRYVNIAVPLLGGNLSTVLRPENLADGGLELTTLHGGAERDEGLYLATPLGAVELPLDQRFRVRPADGLRADSSSADAANVDSSADAFDGDASVVATHEMWAFGRQFLTIRYWGWPRR
jgi:hypothetical protein